MQGRERRLRDAGGITRPVERVAKVGRTGALAKDGCSPATPSQPQSLLCHAASVSATIDYAVAKPCRVCSGIASRSTEWTRAAAGP